MATNSLDSREIFSIASGMDEIHTYLRISHDMVLDQLCEGSPGDLISMGRMQERIFHLVGEYTNKLSEIEVLNDKLMGLTRAENLTA